MTQAVSKTLPIDINAPKFTFVTKAIDGETVDGKRRFRATASSTITDRAGDEISLKALQQMAQNFRSGVTIFLDHKNEVANAFGMTDGAEIIQRGQDAKGHAIWDLDITGNVNEPNPTAVQVHDSISGGYVKHGCSIDAFVLDHERKKSGGLAINGLEAYAASIVGVPMNQRSWTQKAVRAIKSFYGEPQEDDVTEMASQATETDNGSSGATAFMEVATQVAGTTNGTINVSSTSPVVEKADACPNCGGSKGSPTDDCHDDYHSTQKAAEDVDTTVPGTTEPEPSTDGQEAGAATPESDEDQDAASDTEPAEGQDADAAQPEPESDEPAEANKGFDPDDVVALVAKSRELVDEIGLLRQENADLLAENTTLKSLNKATESVAETVEKVLGLPLQRKAVDMLSSLPERFPQLDPAIVKAIKRVQESK